jgi:hypothetical protein
MDTIIILLIIILLTCVLLVVFNNKEHLSLPSNNVFTSLFNKINRKPILIETPDNYFLPYCTDELGRPVPCPVPCNEYNPACQFNYPVPVLSGDIGAYSPSKWTPGAPLN